MTGLRASNKRDGVALSGQRRPPAALLRTCPRCGAAPNQSCRKVTRTGRISGEDVGGGYVVLLKQVHRERRAVES